MVGAARLAFTHASGAPTPVPEQAWAYTDYTYGDPAHVHAATALSTGEQYGYDQDGNMTSRVEGGVTYTQGFDAENRLTTVAAISGTTTLTTTFAYDGDGNLIERIRLDKTATVYVGGIYEVELNASGNATTHTSYYNALTARVMRVDNTVYYILTDQIGSASVTLDYQGRTVGQTRYYAFGETRLVTGSMYTDKLFTGQRQVAEIGLYNFNARFYDPYLKRFISADTVVPRGGDPQALNRYSYVLNDPIRLTDPSGHMVSDDPHWASAFTQAHGYGPTAQDKGDADFAETHQGSGGNGQWTNSDWQNYTQIKKAVLVVSGQAGTGKAGSYSAGYSLIHTTSSLSGALPGDPPPPAWLQEFALIVRSIPPWAEGLFGPGGHRIIMLDGPHPGVDYWHLNTDLKFLEQFNHANVEPLAFKLAAAGAVARSVVQGGIDILGRVPVFIYPRCLLGPIMPPSTVWTD